MPVQGTKVQDHVMCLNDLNDHRPDARSLLRRLRRGEDHVIYATLATCADHVACMQVYQGRLTVDGLVESMMACRQGSPRDRQLFQAVLNVIYEEFQFLHNFPDKELQMTAQVLASLVSTGSSLISSISAARAWPASPSSVSSLLLPMHALML